MELKTFFVQDAQGNILPTPTAHLYLPGTTTLASGLQDANGSPLPNPFVGDANGRIQLAAPDGDYDLRVVKGARSYTMRVRFISVTEDSVAAAASSALAAAGHADDAEAARDAALLAQSGAEDAKNAAEGAQAGAEGAQVGAEAARDVALLAQSGAEHAKNVAEGAQVGAEAARDVALLAQSGAEHAKDAAEDAQAGAEAARDVALLAQSGAEHAKDAAELAQAGAEAARDAATVNANVYVDVAAGLAATSEGDQFLVVSDDGMTIYRYRHDAGPAATLVAEYPSKGAIDDLGFRALPPEMNDGLVFSIADKAGRRLWLEAVEDGGPSKRAAISVLDRAGLSFDTFDADLNGAFLALADKNGRRFELEFGADGRFSERVINSLRNRLNLHESNGDGDYPVRKIAAWGDSMTAGGWPQMLGALLGWEVYNGGWGGQGYSQIAARQGGLPALLTFPGGEVPGDTSAVTLDAIVNTPLSDGGSRYGYVGGVLGKLSRSGDAHTFEREKAGDPVPVVDGVVFEPYDGATRRDWHQFICIGRNSFKDVEPRQIAHAVRAMVSYCRHKSQRVMIFSIPPWVGEPIGSGVRGQLDAANAAIAAAFPDIFFDVFAWLRTDDARDLAMTLDGSFTGWSSGDVEDIGNGYTPRSFRADNGHLNVLGNQLWAHYAHTQMTNLGWI